MNEDELEQLCLEWLRDNSWDIAYGPDIAHDSARPERTDYHEVLLKRYLHEAIMRINPLLPENPPDMAADAVELILKQAEVLSNAWTH